MKKEENNKKSQQATFLEWLSMATMKSASSLAHFKRSLVEFFHSIKLILQANI